MEKKPPAGPESSSSPFLRLPYELRLIIYELLFLSTDDYIAISRENRRIPLGHGPHWVPGCRISARHPYPCLWCKCEVFENRLAVEFLRTCRQVDVEGRRVLYGKNRFFVEHRIVYPAKRGPAHPRVREWEPYMPILKESFNPFGFFLWNLRCSTIRQIRHIEFAAGHKCHSVVFHAGPLRFPPYRPPSREIIGYAHQTTGPALLRQAACALPPSTPPVSSSSRSVPVRTRKGARPLPDSLPLPAGVAKTLYFLICRDIMKQESEFTRTQGWLGWTCSRCLGRG
ncbi:hypothetical protein QBC47DRAFT_368228 [Echria macrotheca]|uniref:DUF7730 domain-containing protein n=1 Tax=Echria macrotheca TaxID=438768 RepID=A0AAJ0FEY7_9PEZI|nr:hypothetical protein QBC47DRAFT_368228 [Echria macrotheca]